MAVSTEVGRQAEAAAADYLEQQGFKILGRNWRNRWCEIDIVAQSGDKTVHFVEVKHRRTDLFGSGFEYVTADKQNRLARAAQVWMAQNGTDRPFQIDVISITGSLAHPKIEYLENVIN